MPTYGKIEEYKADWSQYIEWLWVLSHGEQYHKSVQEAGDVPVSYQSKCLQVIEEFAIAAETKWQNELVKILNDH